MKKGRELEQKFRKLQSLHSILIVNLNQVARTYLASVGMNCFLRLEKLFELFSKESESPGKADQKSLYTSRREDEYPQFTEGP